MKILADTLGPFPYRSIFNDLVEAFLLLEYGGADRESREEEPGWMPVVHRDLKPGNVFLGLAGGDDSFPAYPKARVGDFGCSVMTNEDDPNNPLAYNCAWGTKGWRPPEQFHYLNKNNRRALDNPEKLGSKTNVWVSLPSETCLPELVEVRDHTDHNNTSQGIGAIILRLMNQQHKPKGPMFKSAHKGDSDKFRELGDNAKAQYSEPLQQLASKCMRYKPAKRPSLLSLKRDIEKYTTAGHVEPDGANRPDHAAGMRLLTLDRAPAALHLRYPEDRYKAGMTMGDEADYIALDG